MENILQENSFVLLMVIGILFMLAFALAFVLFAGASQKKLHKEQIEKQELAYTYQENLLHSTILTQEAERKRIARDLHDEIGSKLNVIFLNIHRLKDPDLVKADIKGITDEVETIINTTIDTTRRISHDLLPPTLEEFGIVEAIRELQYNFNKSDKGLIEFIINDKEYPISDKLIELNLYRVVQELINNSIKHGSATKILIQLRSTANQIELEYTDNGQGFDLSELENKKGLGMKNIESRLQMINATWNYISAPGEGAKMISTLNLK